MPGEAVLGWWAQGVNPTGGQSHGHVGGFPLSVLGSNYSLNASFKIAGTVITISENFSEQILPMGMSIREPGYHKLSKAEPDLLKDWGGRMFIQEVPLGRQ